VGKDCFKYIAPYLPFLSAEIDVAVVATMDVAEIFKKSYPLIRAVQVVEGIKMMCVTAKVGVILGLYLLNGEFDLNRVVIS